MMTVVVGTGTEVGKTWVSARVLERLRDAGHAVTAIKPVQSFEADDPAPTDADVLAAATGHRPHDVCPEHRWLPRAMAPPMAAEVLGLAPFTVAELATEIRAAGAHHGGPGGVVLVETAGGLRSPVAADGDSLDLAVALQPGAILLVADAGLGTINLVRLCAAAIGAATGAPLLVHLNRFDAASELHARNAEWIAGRDGLACSTDLDVTAQWLVDPAPRG